MYIRLPACVFFSLCVSACANERGRKRDYLIKLNCLQHYPATVLWLWRLIDLPDVLLTSFFCLFLDSWEGSLACHNEAPLGRSEETDSFPERTRGGELHGQGPINVRFPISSLTSCTPTPSKEKMTPDF